MKHLQNVVALATTLILAGCGHEEAPPVAPSAAISRPLPAPAVSAATFVATNGSIDLFAIRSSQLALQRSSSARIRGFASTMIRDHEGTGAQLSLEGRRLNLLPSATLLSAEQSMLDSLQTSSNFDPDYVRDQRIVHQRAVSIDAAFASSGRSPTLQPVASSTLAIEQRHLRLLQDL